MIVFGRKGICRHRVCRTRPTREVHNLLSILLQPRLATSSSHNAIVTPTALQSVCGQGEMDVAERLRWLPWRQLAWLRPRQGRARVP